MPSPDKSFYQAMVSRDRRFDGRFFAGVTTTGVYCRPVCPAPKPKFQHVRFFPSAAGAEQAGFRPCRRCRPETAPGTPVWSGTSATVSRALKLIEAGVFDRDGVEGLADRLGVGPRQLRRLFGRHLGAPPQAVALTRRLNFARQLIDETTLPLAEVAFAAGFESIRRFNDAVRRRCGGAPRALRHREPDRPDPAAAGLVLRLPYRPPLAWDPLVGFLRKRMVPGLETVTGDAYGRTIALGRATGSLRIRPLAGLSQLELRLQVSSSSNLMDIVQRIRRMFDLDADPLAIEADLGRDEFLAPRLAACPGVRVPGAWDGFELAVRALLGQQVSLAAAATLIGRIVRLHGRVLETPNPEGLTHLFPTPAVLGAADLAGIGLTRTRAAAVSTLARAVAHGELALDGSMSPELVSSRLRAIAGIGPWTVEYISMRALGEPDAFPGTDLALQRELSRLAGGPGRAENWRPWRAYAAMHLWLAGAGSEDAPAGSAPPDLI